MKRYLSIFFILMSVHVLTAQISIELMGGLDRSFRTLSDVDESISSNIVTATREENESPRVQHRFGVNALIQLTPSLYFKSGLRYAQTGYTLITFDGGSFPVPLEVYQDYVYLEVPLQLRWSPLQEGLISPYLEVGVNPHIYIQTATTSVFDDGERRTSIDKDDQNENKFRDLYFVSVASIGVKINLFKSVYIAPQVTGRYHLNQLGKEETPVNENHYNIGGELAVGYRFGK